MGNPSIIKAEPIGVTLTPRELKMAPGSDPVDLVAEVRNAGTTVDQYKIEIEGLDPSWYTIVITSVALFPGNNAQIPLRLHPPKGSATLAGMYTFTVRARSQANPTLSGTAKGTLEVTGFTAFKADLKPRRVVGRKGNYKLTLANGGNNEVQVELAGTDAENSLSFQFKDATPRLDAGSDVTIPVVAKPSKFHFVGKNQHYPFEIAAVPADGNKEGTQTVSGELVHKAIFGSWIMPLLLTIILLLVALTLCGVWSQVRWRDVPIIGPALVPNTPTATMTTTPTATSTPQPLTIKEFDSNANSIGVGDSVTLNWRVVGAGADTNVTLDGTPVSAKMRSRGEATFTLKKTRKFRLCAESATNPDNSDCKPKEVIVQVPPIVLESGAAAGLPAGANPPTGGNKPPVSNPPSGGTGGSGSSGGTSGGSTGGGGTSGGGGTGGSTAKPTVPTSGGPATAPTNTLSPPVAVAATPTPRAVAAAATPTQAPIAVQPTAAATNAADVKATTAGPTTTPVQANHVPDPNCDNSAAVDGQANPPSVQTKDAITFSGSKFTSGEKVSYVIISPSFVTVTAQLTNPVKADGTFVANIVVPDWMGDKPFNWGLWTIVYTGLTSKHTSIIYFCVTPPTGPQQCDVGPDKSNKAMPGAVAEGQRIVFVANGFTPGEPVSFSFTPPSGPPFGSQQPATQYIRDEDGATVPWVGPDGKIAVVQTLSGSRIVDGNWKVTFKGEKSQKQVTIQFCITK